MTTIYAIISNNSVIAIYDNYEQATAKLSKSAKSAYLAWNDRKAVSKAVMNADNFLDIAIDLMALVDDYSELQDAIRTAQEKAKAEALRKEAKAVAHKGAVATKSEPALDPEFFDDEEEYFGSDRYFEDAWEASHPQYLYCD